MTKTMVGITAKGKARVTTAPKLVVTITPEKNIHNYMQVFAVVKAKGLLPGGAFHVTHQRSCVALRGGVCQCRPEIWLNGELIAKTEIAK